jgi:pSer/pThr/pTyr-binding forkhead associated (FHA) protein
VDEFDPQEATKTRETTSLNGLAGSEDPFPFLRADQTRLATSVQPDEGWAGHPNPPDDPDAAPPSAMTADMLDDSTELDLPEPLPVSLTISGPGGEQTVEMAQPRFLLGRRHCDIEIDDPYLDEVHLQLFARDGRLMVADVDSTNGVFLRIADDLTMADGDEVMVGEQRLRFRASWSATESAADDRQTSPVQMGPDPAGSPARLERVLRGGDIASITPINDELTVGRQTGDLRCPEDISLADPHARIIRQGDAYKIRDLDSDTGTFIRIHDQVGLVDGDCFAAGQTRIQVTWT